MCNKEHQQIIIMLHQERQALTNELHRVDSALRIMAGTTYKPISSMHSAGVAQEQAPDKIMAASSPRKLINYKQFRNSPRCHKFWTEEEKAMLKGMWLNGNSIVSISRRLQRNYGAITSMAFYSGLPRRKYGPKA